MHLDWYDREILTFVLDRAAHPGVPDEESFSRFGIASHRVMRRFDAVIDNPTAFCHNAITLTTPLCRVG